MEPQPHASPRTDLDAWKALLREGRLDPLAERATPAVLAGLGWFVRRDLTAAAADTSTILEALDAAHREIDAAVADATWTEQAEVGAHWSPTFFERRRRLDASVEALGRAREVEKDLRRKLDELAALVGLAAKLYGGSLDKTMGGGR